LGEVEDFEYGYKVDLEVFSGPLDLLLYLIRQEEVEITDIPIARITEQYLQHIEILQAINVNLAGEFLLMAATLMEIKSRMLLPRPEEGEEEEEDPRADLIRQLIEYKKFKDAARQLSTRADEQALKFVRGAAAALGLPQAPPAEDLPIVLGEVSVWDLMAAFRTVLRQTSLDSTQHIVLDDRPALAYCNDLLDQLRERRTATFAELFEPGADRVAVISIFLALLELIRRRRLRAEQDDSRREIRIVLLDDTPLAEAELAAPQPPPEPESSPEQAAALPQAEAPEAQPASTDSAQATHADDAAPPKRPRPRRPTAAPLVQRQDTDDDDFGVDHIDVPELSIPPEPRPEDAQPPPQPAPAAPLARRPRPRSLLALLARRRRPPRRPRAVAVVRRPPPRTP